MSIFSIGNAAAEETQRTKARAPLAPLCEYYDSYVDVQGKVGSQRSIGEVILFAPLACSDSELVFLDVRPKIDTRDNYEGNIGIGYRSMGERAIWGVYGYLDLRRSGETGLFHSQITAGTEWLTEDWEARLNAYIPISGKKTAGAGGASSPYLANTGIFIDVGGQTVEKALAGVDAELGRKLSLAPQTGDIWLYGGGYHFRSEGVRNVNGGRVRAEMELGKSTGLALVAEAQYDNKRQEQGLLGLRLRIPLGGKDKNQVSQGLRARMITPPVRDVDIVTGGTQTASETVPVLNSADAQPQRVFHVDNSVAGGGDGSLVTPFNTLAGASAAADRVGDVIYVNSGLGDSTGMATGIAMTREGQYLIGSGTDFIYDGSRFGASVGQDFTGSLLRAASVAPVLTSTAANSDVIRVLADNVSIAGVDVVAARRDGVSIVNATGTQISDVNISGSTRYGIYAQSTTSGDRSLSLDTVTSSNNSNVGIFVNSSGAGRWEDVSFSDVTASQNVGRGILLRANAGGTMGLVNMTDITASQNTSGSGRGIEFDVNGAGSSIDDVNIEGAYTEGNAQIGLYVLAQNSGIYGDVTLRDVVSEANANAGLSILAQTAGSLSSVEMTDIISRGNTGGSGRGVLVNVTGAGSTLAGLTVEDSVFDGNAQQGIYVLAQNSGDVGAIDIARIDSTSNTGAGVLVTAQTLGQMADVTLRDIVATSNAAAGVNIVAQSGGDINGDLDLERITSTGNTGTGGRGVYVVVSGADTSVQDIRITDSVTSGNAQQGTYVIVQTGATAQDISFADITSEGNNHNGVALLVQSAATAGRVDIDSLAATSNTSSNGRGLSVTVTGVGSVIGDVSVRDSLFNDNQTYGMYLVAGTSGVMGDIALSDNVTSRNSSVGTYLVAQGSGLLGNVTADHLTARDNRHAGIYLLSQSGGTVGSAGFSHLLSENNITTNGRGLFVNATGAGTSMGDVTVTDSQFAGNVSQGLSVQASDQAVVGDVVITDVSSNGNTAQGLLVQAQTQGQMQSAALTRVMANANSHNGIHVVSQTAGAMGNLTLTDITANANTGADGRGIRVFSGTSSSIADIMADGLNTNNNVQQGFYLLAPGGTMETVNIRNLVTQNNGQQGLRIETSGAASRILSVAVSDVLSSGNRATGVYLYSTGSSALEAASFERVTATGNLAHGVYVDDDTTGSFVADLGGGVLGSSGENRIFGNTGRDLRVDLDGLQLKAENNWWGTPAGLLPAQTQLEVGSTVDAVPFLAADPNP